MSLKTKIFLLNCEYNYIMNETMVILEQGIQDSMLNVVY
jgi:hypothetical protein